MSYLSIFWRTFAQLASAFLVTVQGYDWAVEEFEANIESVAVGLIAALLGATVAAGWAYVRSPASTALDRSIRSAVQWVLGGLGAVVINGWADLASLPSILVPTLIGAVIAFGITFLQNQPAPQPSTTTGTR
jgi:hypothetical protein